VFILIDIITFTQSSGKIENSAIEKWRWILMDNHKEQNIELDFIFYSNNLQAKQDVKSIIESLKITHQSGTLPNCTSSIN